MQVVRTASLRGRRLWHTARAIALSVVLSLAFGAANPLGAQTLERIKESGHIKLGYLADARPFT
ncbi:hypothetical protein, partial [Salmonella sp. SAL4355]|uniref:hypothetical protein n=1 Tax=Salmonella sp. SAL4355 TaxID=3159876 RepID=UPI00397D0DEE